MGCQFTHTARLQLANCQKSRIKAQNKRLKSGATGVV